MFLFLSHCQCSPSRAPEDLSVETSTSMGNRYITNDSYTHARTHTHTHAHARTHARTHTHTHTLLTLAHISPPHTLTLLPLSPPHTLTGHPVLYPAKDGDQSLASGGCSRHNAHCHAHHEVILVIMSDLHQLGTCIVSFIRCTYIYPLYEMLLQLHMEDVCHETNFGLFAHNFQGLRQLF